MCSPSNLLSARTTALVSKVLPGGEAHAAFVHVHGAPQHHGAWLVLNITPSKRRNSNSPNKTGVHVDSILERLTALLRCLRHTIRIKGFLFVS